MLHRPVLVPMVLVLAGCIGAADLPLDDAGTLPTVVGIEYVCPPGGDTDSAEGLCVGRIASLTEGLQEPFLAVDPQRPNVLAIGVNAGHIAGRADPARERPGLDWFAVDVFVSEDGGESWTARRIPHVDAPQSYPFDTGGSFDPALAFDEHGVLHVSGIVSWERTALPRGHEIFYVSSSDLGRTWSEPVTFTSDSDNDRNWLTVAPGGGVYVSWSNFDFGAEVAWSLDGGATWSEPSLVDGCSLASPVVVHDGVPLLGCTAYTGGDGGDPVCYGLETGALDGIRVLALDVATGELSPVGRVGGATAVWPQMRTLADGALVVAYEQCGPERMQMFVARSEDGGRTWSEPVEALSLASSDDAWPSPRMLGFEADPWGGVQLVVAQPGAQWTSTVAVSHLVLDPSFTRVVSERLVKEEDGTPDRVPPSLGWPAGDHFYGLGFTGDGGLLVWTDEKTLAYTAFRPQLEST